MFGSAILDMVVGMVFVFLLLSLVVSAVREAIEARLQDRAKLLASNPRCHICGFAGADSADHVPAIWQHRHVEGSRCCVLRPAHLRCNIRRGGWRAATKVRDMKRRARG